VSIGTSVNTLDPTGQRFAGRSAADPPGGGAGPDAPLARYVPPDRLLTDDVGEVVINAHEERYGEDVPTE
jgi:hypothetical protein